ncbi:MAG: heme-copper oxidase subunit III [Bacillota bacterium]|nr:MAG: heme-copper oxidase subunit III [Bacillota bacterium]
MPATTKAPPRRRRRQYGGHAAVAGAGLAGARGGGAADGRGRGGRGGDGGRSFDEDEARARSATMAVWLVVAAVLIMFMGFTSTYVVRSAEPGWVRERLPGLLWLNTAVLVASSVTMEAVRWRLRRGDVAGARRALALTAVLGLAFVAGQVTAWLQWSAAGFGVNRSTHAAFFYLLTGTHAAHVTGGLLALIYGLVRFARPAATARALAGTATNIAYYWHFVDVLWLYVFALLLL